MGTEVFGAGDARAAMLEARIAGLERDEIAHGVLIREIHCQGQLLLQIVKQQNARLARLEELLAEVASR